jgi:(2Fe-2S) ferredoxin
VGCLGKCGNGPNVMLLPNELTVGYCNTAAHVVRRCELNQPMWKTPADT